MATARFTQRHGNLFAKLNSGNVGICRGARSRCGGRTQGVNGLLSEFWRRASEDDAKLQGAWRRQSLKNLKTAILIVRLGVGSAFELHRVRVHRADPRYHLP